MHLCLRVQCNKAQASQRERLQHNCRGNGIHFNRCCTQIYICFHTSLIRYINLVNVMKNRGWILLLEQDIWRLYSTTHGFVTRLISIQMELWTRKMVDYGLTNIQISFTREYGEEITIWVTIPSRGIIGPLISFDTVNSNLYLAILLYAPSYSYWIAN